MHEEEEEGVKTLLGCKKKEEGSNFLNQTVCFDSKLPPDTVVIVLKCRRILLPFTRIGGSADDSPPGLHGSLFFCQYMDA